MLAIGAALVAGVLAAGAMVNHGGSTAEAKHAANRSNRNAIELETNLSLRQEHSLIQVVAQVSILNTGDQPIAYVGSACLDPATVRLESTRPMPAGPAYAPGAAALRARVMEYRRSLDDGSLMFANESPVAKSCNQAGPPLLAPHVQLQFTLSDSLDSPNYAFVDSATTDVVTSVQLGNLLPSQQGRPPVPVEPTDTVTERIPLASLATVVKASAAHYDIADIHFAAVMAVPAVASWINRQSPADWHDVELRDADATGAWKLTAFHHAWATPLQVSGVDTTVTSTTIPTEPLAQPLTVDATGPPAASAKGSGYIPDRDIYAGDLVLPSDGVMVGDPVATDGMLRFGYGLPPGAYPVHVVTARPPYLGEDYARPAYEELLLSSQPVTRWEPAVPVGHSARELKPGDLFTWATDGGSAGFASPEAMKFMDATLSQDDFGDYGKLTNRETANGWTWGLLTVDDRTGANVFGCESGFGDGDYPVLLGVDASGRPAVLLSDFGVLELSFTGIA